MTALPPPVSDLEVRLGLEVGDLTGASLARATAAIADATALVLSEVSDAKAHAWEAAAPKVITTIILKAARREFENPQGLRTETVGEHGITVDEASGVYLTPGEVVKVRRAAGASAAGFTGTVRTPSGYSWDGLA